MPSGAIAIAVAGLALGLYFYAKKKGREQEQNDETRPPVTGRRKAPDIWWSQVWGPHHPHVPDLIEVEDAADTVRLYDWKTELDRRPKTVVGPGRGREWHAT